MLKRGLDQITAWILAVVLTGLAVTGIYFATRWSANRHPLDADEKAEKAPEPGKPHVEGTQEGEEPDLGPEHEAPAATKDAEAAPVKAPAHAGPNWDYKGSLGPEHWGELADEFTTCKAGKRQSPIDIDEPVTNGKLLPIKFHYKEADVVWKNLGHTVQGDLPSGNFIEIDGERYDLVQFHFHAPSEHKISSIPYDLEMHLVHKNAEGKLAVVAVLFEEGKTNAVLAPLWKVMPSAGETNPEPIAFDVGKTLPSRHTYYEYPGSLTTPPCTEGVKWFVLTMPGEVASKQVDEFVRVVTFNARPVQPLSGRKVVKSTR